MGFDRSGSRGRGHEFRSDRVRDRLFENPIDLRLVGLIERPAADVSGRLQLAGMARAPQSRGDTLVEHPADCQVNDALAEALLGKPVQPLHGGKILPKPRLLEFRIAATKIVAAESRIRPHPTGEETSAEGAIAKSRDLVP